MLVLLVYQIPDAMYVIKHVGRAGLLGNSILSSFRLQSARCTIAPILAASSVPRDFHSLRPTAATNLASSILRSDAQQQSRHRHDDGAASRMSTEPPLPPMPVEVFNRRITIPPAVVDYLTSGETGNGGDISGRRSYNAVWLRENCRCPQCHNTSTEQRAVVFHRLSPDAFDSMSVVATEDRRLEVLWADGHVSSYQLDSLERLANPSSGSSNTGAGAMTPACSGRYGRRLWDATRMSDADAQLERVDYRDLVAMDATATTSRGSDGSVPNVGTTDKSRAALKALLGNLLRHGFAFVDNVPTDLESTMLAATRICPPMVSVVGLHARLASCKAKDPATYTRKLSPLWIKYSLRRRWEKLKRSANC